MPWRRRPSARKSCRGRTAAARRRCTTSQCQMLNEPIRIPSATAMRDAAAFSGREPRLRARQKQGLRPDRSRSPTSAFAERVTGVAHARASAGPRCRRPRSPASSTSPRKRRASSRPGNARPGGRRRMPCGRIATTAVAAFGKARRGKAPDAASRRRRRARFRRPRSARRRSAPPNEIGRRADRSRPARPTWTSRPARISAMRSAMRIASSGSCVTITQVTRLSRSTCERVRRAPRRAGAGRGRRTARPSAARSAAARPRGRARRAAARRPRACADRASRIAAQGRRARARAAPRARLPRAAAPCRPNITLARLVRCGNSAKSWNIRPTPRLSGGRMRRARDTSLVVDQDAARARPLDAGGEPQQRRLAAAGRPEQADDLARRDVEAEIRRRRRTAP